MTIKQSQLLFLSILWILSGCKIIGPYPYTDRSNVHSRSEILREQEFQEEIVTPMNAVCDLNTVRKNALIFKSFKTGSGALVEGRYIITAAHNIAGYPWGYLNTIEVNCGKATTSRGTYEWLLTRPDIKNQVEESENYTWRIYNRNLKFEYDFGFIDLGAKTDSGTYFKVSRHIQPTPGDTVYLAGYPAGSISNGDSLYRSQGVIIDIDQNLMTYDIRTAGGNSGGPVWVKGDDGSFYLIGVHIAPSTSRIFNDSFFKEWEDWKTERLNQ